MNNMLKTILEHYGLVPDVCQVIPFGSGLINHTFKVNTPADDYILQQINTSVFKKPRAIAENLLLVGDYLKNTAPNYLFVGPIKSTNGQTLVELNGLYYRLFPFIPKSHTVNFLTDSEHAYQAARQFGKFTSLLTGFDNSLLQYPLPDFHNLTLRVDQFNNALKNADTNRIKKAKDEIALVQQFKNIGNIFEDIKKSGRLPLRVVHHDTKINNVLFGPDGEGLCIIDLDTVMPGYFISDVGDMMRTYLAEADEEEQDLDKFIIRDEFFEAIYRGYTEEMGDILTKEEKSLFIYSGKFMIYMQALRFLTDFLSDDIYYQTKYPDHNLVRVKNQLRLLSLYVEKEFAFRQMINKASG